MSWSGREPRRAQRRTNPNATVEPSAVAEALVAELTRLPLPDIVAFDQVLNEVADQADTWDVCAACWIIEYGFLSDDGFSDFQAGLVGLGRRAFESAARDPDSLADHPAVRQISASEGRDLWIGDEALQFAAQTAYEQLTGDDEAFWDAVESTQSATTPPEPSPEPDDDRWDLRDEDEWRTRLPRLLKLFRARRPAME